jgi:hypothetical protein
MASNRTEYQTIFLGSRAQLAHRWQLADNLTAICEPIVYTMCDPQHLTTSWPVTGIAFVSDRRTEYINVIYVTGCRI